MARLDRLAPVKEVAQIGAAIGREFSHELLARRRRCPESELQAALARAGRPSWSSAAGRRPRRPTASSTRWSRTPPTRACCARSASTCTPGSPPRSSSISGDRAGAARAAGPPLHGGGAGRTGDRLLAEGGPASHRPLGYGRGACAVAERAGPARGPAGGRSGTGASSTSRWHWAWR